MSTVSRYGWHFRQADGRFDRNIDDDRQPQVGERLQALGSCGQLVKRVNACCRPGFHAIPTIQEHYYRSFGPRLSFVLIEGVPARLKKTRSKFAGTHRTILWEGVVPKSKAGSPKSILAWATANGFRRASCRRKAAKLGLRTPGK